MTTEREETPEERLERWRSIAIGGKRAGGTPTKKVHRPMQKPVWEGAPVRDHRGVPYVHASTSQPVTAKQFADNRTGYEKQIRQLRNAPPKQR